LVLQEQIDIATGKVLHTHANVTEAAASLNRKYSGRATIWKCCNGKVTSAYGFRWESVFDENNTNGETPDKGIDLGGDKASGSSTNGIPSASSQVSLISASAIESTTSVVNSTRGVNIAAGTAPKGFGSRADAVMRSTVAFKKGATSTSAVNLTDITNADDSEDDLTPHYKKRWGFCRCSTCHRRCIITMITYSSEK
jgi:hypothetical protein